MTHAWLNLLAVFFYGFMGTNAAVGTENYPKQSEYAVVERITEDEAILETSRGYIGVPLAILPPMEKYEGAVLEIRAAPEERERRLALGQARLHRMKGMSQISEL